MGSSRRFLKQYNSIANGSMAANLTSAVTNILGMDNIGVQIEWTGTPTAGGTFQVQVSSDYNQDAQGNVLSAGHWVSISLSPAPSIATGSPIFINLTALAAPWVRVTYTAAGSGAGSLNVWISGKGAA